MTITCAQDDDTGRSGKSSNGTAGQLKRRELSQLLRVETDVQSECVNNLEAALAKEDYSRVDELMSYLDSPVHQCMAEAESQVLEVRVTKLRRRG